MAADDYLLSILATFKDSASPELKKLGQAITGVEKTTKTAEPRTRSLGSAITAISGQFLVATQAAGQVVAAVKKFYEFGKAGAIIEQTEQSFDGLIDKLGVTPDLLDDLRDASAGTITDMRLMSATTTLLAGAQGELATGLAEATPELLEIAKAANKLNPSLGDTAFLYESLATGIKRASPMILDNLGLTIKIGEANEKYAESIGKTVEQLTAEEQKMALLAETRRAGRVLIEQAGGAADSATDDFARLETEIENVSNALKKELAPAAGTAAKALIHLTGVVGKTELDLEIDRIERSNLRYKDKVKAINDLVAEYNWLVDAQGRVVQGYWEENEAGERVLRTTDNVVLSSRILTKARVAAATEQGKALQELVRSRNDVTDATDYQTEAEWRAAQAARDEADAIDALTAKHRGLGGVLDYTIDRENALELAGQRAAYSQQLLRASLAELGIITSGTVGNAISGFTGDQELLADKIGDAREELRLLEDKMGTMSRGGGIGQLRTDLEGIVVEMNALGPEPEKLNRGREAVMRGLEVQHLEASKALRAQEAAAGAYGATTKKAEELRLEIRELEHQMRDAQVEHGREMENIIFSLAEQSIAASGLIEKMGQPAVDLQWALAEAMGQVDRATLQNWNATQQINKLYEDQIITIDEAVALYEELADIAAEPAPPPPMAQDIAVLARAGLAWDAEEMAELPAGMQELFDEIETARLEAIPEEIESEIVIENIEDTLSHFKLIDGLVTNISGRHSVVFQVGVQGQWPGSDGDGGGDGGGGGGGSTPPPGSPFANPSRFQFGGLVESSGLAFVEAGELIIPPMEAQQMQQGGGLPSVTYGDTNEFNLNVTSVQEMTSLIQEFEVMRAMVG